MCACEPSFTCPKCRDTPSDHRYELEEVEPSSEEEYELRGLWLSRKMFGWMVGSPEPRNYEDWLAALGMRLA